VSAPVIAAHARHTVLLQPGETVAECFGLDTADTHEQQQQLTFEVGWRCKSRAARSAHAA
jgi:hypothetical protein